MSNKFVVQYTIKARDHFSKVANKVASSTKKMRDSISNSAKTVGAMGAATTLPILLAAKKLKDAARDAQEIDSKFQTIFESVSKNANKAATDLAKNYGLARSESQDMIANTAHLLQGSGMQTKAALQLSVQLQKLAVDQASFTNYAGGSLGASQAFTKALLGEREMLKSLNIAISEKEVKSKLATMASQGLVYASEAEAKAFATVKLIAEKSGKAVGDYARTKDDLANRERQLAADMKTLGEQMGIMLLPLFLKLTNQAIKIANAFMGLSDGTKKAILYTAGLIAVIAPLALLLAGIPFVIAGIKLAFIGLASVAGLVFSPIGIAIAGITAAGYLLISNWDKIKSTVMGVYRVLGYATSIAMSSISDQLNKAGDNVMERWNSVKNAIMQIFRSITTAFENSAAMKIFTGIKGGISTVSNMFSGGGAGIASAGQNKMRGGIRADANINVSLDNGLKENEAMRQIDVTRFGAMGAL